MLVAYLLLYPFSLLSTKQASHHMPNVRLLAYCTQLFEQREEEALKRRLEQAAKMDLARFNDILAKAGEPDSLDDEDWEEFTCWMYSENGSAFAGDLDPDEYADSYADIYDVWLCTDAHYTYVEERQARLQGQLDNGEWADDEDTCQRMLQLKWGLGRRLKVAQARRSKIAKAKRRT